MVSSATAGRCALASAAAAPPTGASDKLVGSVLLLISIVVYVYYTAWVILTPFIEKDHPVQKFFLPYHYAIALPAALLVLLFTGAVSFIGLVMIRSKNKKKSD